MTVIRGVPVVTTPGELDITNAPQLESALRAVDGTGTLVVDMSQTRFCDSSALHALLAAHTRLRPDGGGLLLVIGEDAVLRVFEITGADQLIPNVTTLDQALARTSGGAGEHQRASHG